MHKKVFILATVVFAGVACAETRKLTIPADAVKNDNGTYSYTDKEGKDWIYGRTPFGIVRKELGSGNRVTATDNGDTVTFVRQTPMGPAKWQRKKSELTDSERRVLESQQAPAEPK